MNCPLNPQGQNHQRTSPHTRKREYGLQETANDKTMATAIIHHDHKLNHMATTAGSNWLLSKLEIHDLLQAMFAAILRNSTCTFNARLGKCMCKQSPSQAMLNASAVMPDVSSSTSKSERWLPTSTITLITPLMSIAPRLKLPMHQQIECDELSALLV